MERLKQYLFELTVGIAIGMLLIYIVIVSNQEVAFVYQRY